ncbi:putative aspartyl protease [Wickerhamomyces ciferrii]|uniref:Aspartyl protease n=1 Tax=Wickerhamomyces ciferrii (strain ATCC 14091 / BCRC 22168 / CBS 111 / JCM 3599 / NBRC 0793 / NRRL Y-1031 F-60-10) TaxID=1206466 RepID=K0KLW3_WICCF|nr:putative aspartyl protease [Wickerhamomyces ciferrii]CCH43986.1 putative aspartyl protease [Wickerhamomyces ciferrii]
MVFAASDASSSTTASSISTNTSQKDNSRDNIKSSASSSSSSSSNSSSSSTNLSPFPTVHGFSDNGNVYSVNVSIGNPAQDLQLRIDTAQPYIWVPDGNYIKPCSEVNSSEVICAYVGSFKSQYSDTYHSDNSSISYALIDGIVANGTVGEDSFVINDVDGGNVTKNITLDSTNFINSNDSTIGIGGLGLAGEIQLSPFGDNYNAQFLELLKDADHISSNSYSLYVKDNETAELILGGINQDYYQGDLVYFDKIPFYDIGNGKLSYSYPVVPLSGLSVSNNEGNTFYISTSNDTEPVMFDTRSTRSFLPYNMIVQIAVQLNAFYSEDDDVWFLRCDIAELGGTINFQFGNLTIPYPIEKLILDSPYVFTDGSEACELTIQPNDYFGYSVFGAAFLKEIYLVVDNEGDKIALAQAANPTSSHSLTNHSTTEYHKSAISSGYIPFAKPNNITQSYSFSYNFNRSASSFQPDVITASITGNEIYTGRTPQTNTTSQESSTYTAAANRLDHYPVNVQSNSLYMLIYTFLGVVGIGLLI